MRTAVLRLLVVYALLGWQAASLLSLPVALSLETPVAPAATARPGDKCALDHKCAMAALPAQDDPCRLVCVADAGALAWLSLVGILPRPAASPATLALDNVRADRTPPLLGLARAPFIPPPEAL